MESDPPFLENYKTLFAKFMEEGNIKSVDNERKPSIDDHEYELPLIDLSRLGLGDLDRKECKSEVARAASEWGIFQVVNHGISNEILARVKREQQKLFRQPFQKKANEKFLNLSTDCYRWGTPSATSWMQFSWSEAFHMPLDNIMVLKESNSTTLGTTIVEFAEMVSDLAQRIADILAENLLGCGSSTDFFAKNCKPNSCYLRMNRYPPCPISPEVCGLVPHTDSDFLTILSQDQVGGLQMVRDGKWVSIKPNPEALIINIGDLFEAWSNGVYKSIEHRVVTNPVAERFSVAYFLCPSNDTIIHSFSETEPSFYREFSFGEYRKQTQEDVKSIGGKIGLPRFIK